MFSLILMDKKILYAVSIIVGTSIGAGILGLPYALKDNLYYGIFALIFVSLIIFGTNVMLTKAMFYIKKKKQLIGYIDHYLGSKGKYIMTVAFALSMYGAIVAYLFGMSAILVQIIGMNKIFWFVLIMFLVYMVVHHGISWLKRFEFVLTSLLILLLFAVIIYSFNSVHFSLTNFRFTNTNIFLMIGVSVFAFLNMVALPELNELYRFDKKYVEKLTKIAFLGSLVPLIMYILFVIAIVGVNALTNDLATIALYDLFNNGIGLIANIIALISMLTSYIALSFGLFQMYKYDYGLSKDESLLFTFFIPIILLVIIIVLGYGFVDILGFTGSVAGGLQGLMIVLMYRKYCKKSRRYTFLNQLAIGFFSVFYSLLILMYLLP